MAFGETLSRLHMIHIYVKTYEHKCKDINKIHLAILQVTVTSESFNKILTKAFSRHILHY